MEDAPKTIGDLRRRLARWAIPGNLARARGDYAERRIELRQVFRFDEEVKFPQHLRSLTQLAPHEPPAEDEILAAQMLHVGAEGSGYVQIGDTLA